MHEKAYIRVVERFVASLILCISLGCGVSVKVGSQSESLAVASVSPGTITAGSSATQILVNGRGFLSDSEIQVSGTDLATTFISDTQLKATIPLPMLSSPGKLLITVRNRPGSVASQSSYISVVNPVPVIAGLSPSKAIVGSNVTLAITGTGFVPGSSVLVNGEVHGSMFVNANQLTVSLQAAELSSIGSLNIAVENCAPGGGTSPALALAVVAEPLTLGKVSPGLLQLDGPDTLITLTGTGFSQHAIIEATAGPITIDSIASDTITATVPASLLKAQGVIDLKVVEPGNPETISNTVQLDVGQLPQVKFVSPSSAPLGSPEQTIVVTGTGFIKGSVVQWNGSDLETTVLSGETLSAIVPAAKLSGFSNNIVTAAIPSLSVASATGVPFTVYLRIPNNDIVYRANDGLLYASIPAAAGAEVGNSIVAIDPDTGAIAHSILLGSEPNKLALSSDGNQLYVSQDSAHGYRQVDLSSGAVSSLYPLLDSSDTDADDGAAVTSMAVMPGQPNTVAIYSSGYGTAVYDAGTPRPNISSMLFAGDVLSGALAFSPDGNTLYAAGRWGLFSLVVDPLGFTGYQYLYPLSLEPERLQYDGGRLYQSNGVVYDLSAGRWLGPFRAAGSASVTGPLVSDAEQMRAFGFADNLVPTSIQKFDEITLDAIGSLDIAGVDILTYPYVPQHLLRWGKDGLAFRTSSQIFSLKGVFVRDGK